MLSLLCKGNYVSGCSSQCYTICDVCVTWVKYRIHITQNTLQITQQNHTRLDYFASYIHCMSANKTGVSSVLYWNTSYPCYMDITINFDRTSWNDSIVYNHGLYIFEHQVPRLCMIYSCRTKWYTILLQKEMLCIVHEFA